MRVEKCLIKFKFRKPGNLGQSCLSMMLIPILKVKGACLQELKITSCRFRIDSFFQRFHCQTRVFVNVLPACMQSLSLHLLF